MSYSPADVMEHVKITQETFRHWRQVLPPLMNRKGRKRYTSGDLLALTVAKELTTAGFQIKSLVPLASDLFDFCNSINWDRYQNKFLAISLASRKVDFVDESRTLADIPAPFTVIDINTHITLLRNKLLGQNPLTQLEMAFPPRLVVNPR